MVYNTYCSEVNNKILRADVIAGDKGLHVDIFVNTELKDRFYINPEHEDDDLYIDSVIKSYFKKWK